MSHERGLNLWVVGDNVRKGAATNAIQIAEIWSGSTYKLYCRANSHRAKENGATRCFLKEYQLL